MKHEAKPKRKTKPSIKFIFNANNAKPNPNGIDHSPFIGHRAKDQAPRKRTPTHYNFEQKQKKVLRKMSSFVIKKSGKSNFQNDGTFEDMKGNNSQISQHNRQRRGSKRLSMLKGLLKKKLRVRHSAKTLKGHCPGRNKPNQDRFLVCDFQINGVKIHLFAVADGHGTNGHHVSETTVKTLQEDLQERLRKISDSLEEVNEVKAAINETCDAIHDELKATGVNLKYSGTTLVFALIIDQRLYLANVGDSRAVLGSKVKGRLRKSLETEDHNPDIPEEQERIEKMNGRVCPIIDEYGEECGPMRVWARNLTEPGLAMSRSLGDTRGHQLGVIHKPGKNPTEFS